MNKKDCVFELVKAAIELAIVRHGLETEDCEIDNEHREEIVIDTWNALNGIDTCHSERATELTAVLEAMK